MKKIKIDKKILILPNYDKDIVNKEKWDKDRDPLNFPHPYRLLLASIQPNVGKTNLIHNILLRANPPFKKIYLFHLGGETTQEYKDVDCELLNEIPEPNDSMFDKKAEKQLLIIEDQNSSYFKKEVMLKFDRFLGYTSSHLGLSIICSTQSFWNVPKPIRELCNIYIIWKSKDIDSLKLIGKKCGLSKEEIIYLMFEYVKDYHDSLWLDCSKYSPYPVRINGYQIIPSDLIKQKSRGYLKSLNIKK